MKKLINATITALVLSSYTALNARATIVSFTVSGMVDYLNNPSNSLPASIQYGGLVTGTITYDTSPLVSGGDVNVSTNEGDFYFGTNGGFSISMTVGGHTFANIKHTQPFPTASVNLINNFNGKDEFEADDNMPFLRMDGGSLPGNPDSCGISLDLVDDTAVAFDSDALPTTPLPFIKCSGIRRIELNGHTVNGWFGITATITNIAAAGQPPLAIKMLPNKSVLLSWPVSYSGYSLLQNTNLSKGAGWTTNATPAVDTATDHTVTLPGSKTQCLFRLKSP